MKSRKRAQALIARINEAEAESGGKFKVPDWLKNEDGVASGRKMNAAEQREFNQLITEILRSSVASVYLMACERRWGKKHDAPVFISGDISLGITGKVIEVALVTHIEPILMENKKYSPDEAVVYFYMGHELNKKEDRNKLTDLLDDVFTAMCAEIRSNDYQMLPTPVRH
ncbi:hypothetical protein G3M83_07125 [Rouxiella badensis]|uniref:hypothetical protein n=1 Tax=Rouxiella badensis TaxID=1646377 RepID=UPI0013EF3BA7|nr:hypothetical protein [Rouxiella badensis]QII37484.1 hypothetical protein G3M83_07125 [Rouxiella badensis]